MIVGDLFTVFGLRSLRYLSFSFEVGIINFMDTQFVLVFPRFTLALRLQLQGVPVIVEADVFNFFVWNSLV